jgi:uncharacterized protein (DUF927 family)
MGLTGWPEDEAVNAASVCFQAWLAHRSGGGGSSEDAAGLAQVRAFLFKHGDARFEWIDRDSQAPIIRDRAGWLREAGKGHPRQFLIPRESWVEICQGLNPDAVARHLVSLGHIAPGNDRKTSQVIRIPGIAPTRVFAVACAILGDDDTGE